MAGGRIAGITIKIGGDTTELNQSLRGVDKELKKTQSTLRDVDKLLKLDPTNTELLTQKQKALKSAIDATKERLKMLKEAQSKVQEGTAEWDALQREIVATEQSLGRLESEYRQFGSVAAQQVIAVGNKLQDVGKKVDDVGKKLRGFSGAGAAVLTALTGLGYKAVTAADEMQTLSDRTGLTTEEIQKFQYASDRVDVSLESMTGAMSKMKKNMTGQPEVWESLGVSVTNADGSLRNTTEVFYETIEALSHIENETERDLVAMSLFGRGADELAGIIDDGGQSLRAYGQEAEDLGLILDQDVIDQMNEVNDQIDKSKAQLKATGLQLGAKVGKVLIPIIEKIAAGIEKLIGWMDKLSPKQLQVIMTIAGIIAVVAPLLMIIGKIITGIGMAITVVGKIMTVMAAVNPVVLIIIAVIAALIAIGVLLYKNWDKIKAKAQELWANVVAKFNAIKDGIATALEAAKEKVTEIWNNIKTTITTTIDNVKTAVTNKVETMKSNVISKFNALKDAVSNVIEKIKGLFKFEWKLPKIKLPHVVGEGADMHIEWYRSAYDNPVVFTSPTVIGTPSGAKGFGDGHGAEIVMGLDKLREMVGSQSENVTVNVVLQGDARGLFKVVSQTNNMRTRATGYNALAMG